MDGGCPRRRTKGAAGDTEGKGTREREWRGVNERKRKKKQIKKGRGRQVGRREGDEGKERHLNPFRSFFNLPPPVCVWRLHCGVVRQRRRRNSQGKSLESKHQGRI